MSKLDRLNARVAKLLTEAVHEVLEVVKETVTEYQEKTARTHRENESLKRRLQELQEHITRESAAAAPTYSPLPEEKEELQHQEQHTGLVLRQNLDLPTEQNPDIEHKPDQEVKQELNQHESYNNVELPSECNTTQATKHSKALPEELAHAATEAITVQASHTAHRDVSAVTSDTVCSSQSSTALGMSLSVVKREPGPTDSSASEQPSLQTQYSGCVDLSCNSTRLNSDEANRPQLSTESQGLVFVHSNHATPRRFGFAKTHNAAFGGRKFKMEDFGREETLCVVCGKTFSRVGNLRIHQRCHTGEKPYGCVQCGRRFSQAGDLKKHKRVHTGEKPYYCNQCGKSFSRGENLRRHQKIHIGKILHLQQVWSEQQQ